MDDVSLKAANWYLFTSTEFIEAAAREAEATAEWFDTLAASLGVSNFGRNSQICDTFRIRALQFRRGAALALHDDFTSVWNTANSIRGDVRGIIEQPLHSWMTDAEYEEFDNVRISRLMTYAGLIGRALNNAMYGADSYFDPDPEGPERSDDDDSFPGDEILEAYQGYEDALAGSLICKLPQPLPEYIVDTSIACHTGEEVPSTGVWYPGKGLCNCGLTFAIKGLRMQPAYQDTKTTEQVEAEGVNWPYPQTIAVSATWHPLILKPQVFESSKDLWSKAGQPCPKAGVWETTDPGAAKRSYQAGEPMVSLHSAYGITVWRWVADR